MNEDQRRQAEREMEQLLLEGLDSGSVTEVNAEFWKGLHAEALELLLDR